MSNSNSSRGIGFLDVLVIMFIILKLTGVITWSWWLVFAPWLIPLAIVLVVIIIISTGNGGDL